ncbi:nucleoside diphosphate kinase [Kickxella alabastrina]|uniref:nucleoside diphosphate kinase n=1 Tax=Kickxella alabastrina TaxID=61397 RepID=UPI002220E5CE|nr:nucleoside diphosphate kinase [Kickxella alabastrina]KAI7826657.1 nucleoside diphosphate kinase [Kickxella alabastrina]
MRILTSVSFVLFSTLLLALLSSPSSCTPPKERSFIAVKPDGVQRGLVGEILRRFETRGFKILALQLVHPSKELLSEHYSDLAGKAFFPSLLAYMQSGPVAAFVIQGKGAVKIGRDSAPGTIRADFALDIGKNVCHGSDSVEAAEREIGLWFPQGLKSYTRAVDTVLYE